MGTILGVYSYKSTPLYVVSGVYDCLRRRITLTDVILNISSRAKYILRHMKDHFFLYLILSFSCTV